MKNQKNLTDESSYTYLSNKSNLKCRKNIKPYNLGAKVSDYFYTGRGDEELLKRLVFEHGADMTGVFGQSLHNYGGGILTGCDPKINEKCSVNHGVTVVGYGSEGSNDYWLIKIPGVMILERMAMLD